MFRCVTFVFLSNIKDTQKLSDDTNPNSTIDQSYQEQRCVTYNIQCINNVPAHLIYQVYRVYIII